MKIKLNIWYYKFNIINYENQTKLHLFKIFSITNFTIYLVFFISLELNLKNKLWSLYVLKLYTISIRVLKFDYDSFSQRTHFTRFK
jgi:hypothetical protein